MISYNDKATKLINTLHFCGLVQQSSVFNYSGVILDLVLSNVDLTVNEISSDDLLAPIDHHHPALNIQLSINQQTFATTLNVSQFKFWDADYNIINDQLISTNWDDILHSSDVNQMLASFYKKLYEIIDCFVPKKYKNNTKYPC